MNEGQLLEQAEAVASLLPRLMRALFVVDEGDPGMVLPVAQLRVCGILRDGPRTMSALSDELGISHSAITQIADRLERSGMVERVPETADRRAKSLRLTRHGAEIMGRRAERRRKRILEVLERLSPESRGALVSSMRALLEACAASASDADAGAAIPDALIR